MERVRGLTRRNFLKLGGAGLLSWMLGGSVSRAAEVYYQAHRYDEALKIWLDLDNEAISFEEAAQLTARLSKITDTFKYVPDVSEEAIIGWTKEILPFFRSEGIVLNVKEPTIIELRAFLDTVEIGWSDCSTEVWLNERLANPYSLLYRDLGFLARLVHELLHSQQGIYCEIVDPDLVEKTAQIVAWKILATIANSGRPGNKAGKEAAYALVIELRDAAFSAAAAVALRNGDPDSLRKLVKQISPGALAESRLERALRKYKLNPTGAQKTLTRYSEKPLAAVIKAHKETGDKIYGLPLDPAKARYVGGGSPYVVDYDTVLEVDDLIYFLGHAGEMIADYNSGRKKLSLRKFFLNQS